MQAAWQTFYSVAQPIINLVLTGFEMLVEGIQNLVGTTTKDLPSIGTIVKNTFNFVLSTVQFTADAIEIAFENMPAALKLLFTTAANSIITILEKIINKFGNMAAEAAAIIALVDPNTAIKVQDKIRDLTTVKLDHIKYSEDEVDVALKLAAAHEKAFSTDNITALNKEFEGTLSNIVKLDKLGQTSKDVLDNVFQPGGTGGDEVDEKALKKLQKQREQYTNSLQKEFDSLRTETGQAQIVAQEWYDGQKAKLAELGLSWEEYGGKIDAIFENKMKEAYKKDLENASNWEAGVERAAMKLQESFGDAADAAESVFTSVFSSLEDSLTDFVTDGEFSLGNLEKAITRVALQQAVLKPMSEYFSTGGGSSIISGLFGSGGGSLFSGLFKEGGLSTSPVSGALVPASAFDHAKKFKSGGFSSGGGFPAILHPARQSFPLP